jgi:hypothetical protein
VARNPAQVTVPALRPGRPDQTVTFSAARAGPTPEAENIDVACDRKLARSKNGHVPLSQDNLQKMEKCDLQQLQENSKDTNHAVLLPIADGARQKCGTQVTLSTGAFRICAALLQQSPERLTLEYEEDSSYNRDFRVTRARFDILLQRSRDVPLGHIWGCTLNVTDALSFNPYKVPYQDLTNKICRIDNTNYNGVAGNQPPPKNPEDQAILAAAQRKTTVCMPRAGGGYVASIYDSELTGSGDAIVETASLNDKGQLHFMNSKVFPGEIAWNNAIVVVNTLGCGRPVQSGNICERFKRHLGTHVQEWRSSLFRNLPLLNACALMARPRLGYRRFPCVTRTQARE